ncbi:MAG: hypothetical protein Q7S02_00890 [bacterium]|nr:hypothetical protein [bacterium]
MERLTWLMRFVLAAACAFALSCGGNGGTGDDDGGTPDDDDGDDTDGRNPLIDAIPGFWYAESFDGQPNPNQPPEDDANEVMVDTTDPNCSKWFECARSTSISSNTIDTTSPECSNPPSPEWIAANPPGDACVRPPRWGLDGFEGIPSLILDGTQLRLSFPAVPAEDRGSGSITGEFTDDGTRIDVIGTGVGSISGGNTYSYRNVYRRVLR